MKRICITIFCLFFSLCNLHALESYSFNCTLHRKDGAEIAAKAVIYISPCASAHKRSQCLSVDVSDLSNPSETIFSVNTNPLFGGVSCAYTTKSYTDPELPFAEYVYFFSFESDFGPDTSSTSFQIGVYKAKEYGMNTAHIFVRSYVNKKSIGSWITVAYKDEIWRSILNIIQRFKSTHAYSDWYEAEIK